MGHRIAADLIVLFHFLFVAFVAGGGLLALKWPALAWVHVPAALWGVLITLNGWVCPLTPLENRLRVAGGGQGYSGGFIEQYIWPLIYPPGLTRDTQVLISVAVVALNLVVYAVLILRLLRRTPVA
jgi:hypothetical protein